VSAANRLLSPLKYHHHGPSATKPDRVRPELRDATDASFRARGGRPSDAFRGLQPGPVKIPIRSCRSADQNDPRLKEAGWLRRSLGCLSALCLGHSTETAIKHHPPGGRGCPHRAPPGGDHARLDPWYATSPWASGGPAPCIRLHRSMLPATSLMPRPTACLLLLDLDRRPDVFSRFYQTDKPGALSYREVIKVMVQKGPDVRRTGTSEELRPEVGDRDVP